MGAGADTDGFPGGSPEEVARESAARMWAADAASQAAGMSLDAVGPGRCEMSMPVRAEMVNGHGTCHGGYVFALADSAFAFACNTGGTTTVAAGADITFLAPARLGDVLVAVAAERARAGRSGVYDVTVHRGRGAGAEVVAEFRGRSRTVPGVPFPGHPSPREEPCR